MENALPEASSNPRLDDHDRIALIRRYRRLCEATGLARAHRMPLAEDVASELAEIEARLEKALLAAEERPKVTNGRVEPPTDANARESISHAGSAEAPPVSATPATATVFTDGSAESNPGPGGYGAIVRMPGLPDRELSGGTNHTTNNKMELSAAIVGVGAALDAGAAQVTVISDSEYLVKGMTRWLAGWQSKGWKTADGQPVKNRELWERLAALAQRGQIRWQWIRGHAGHPENERCDVIATAAARKAASGR
jgi:ribonuclease HI